MVLETAKNMNLLPRLSFIQLVEIAILKKDLREG